MLRIYVLLGKAEEHTEAVSYQRDLDESRPTPGGTIPVDNQCCYCDSNGGCGCAGCNGGTFEKTCIEKGLPPRNPAPIEAVWREFHIERIHGHDMTYECRLAAAIIALRAESKKRAEEVDQLLSQIEKDDFDVEVQGVDFDPIRKVLGVKP